MVVCFKQNRKKENQLQLKSKMAIALSRNCVAFVCRGNEKKTNKSTFGVSCKQSQIKKVNQGDSKRL